MTEVTDPTYVFLQQPTRTEYVTRTVHEHRAPTDDSVKLLREMEAKAEAEVLKSVSVQGGTFDCVVHQMRDMLSDKVKWRAVFKLNGHRMTVDVENVETDPRRDKDYPNEPFAKLRDEMAKVIAAEVLGDAFMATMRARWNR